MKKKIRTAPIISALILSGIAVIASGAYLVLTFDAQPQKKILRPTSSVESPVPQPPVTPARPSNESVVALLTAGEAAAASGNTTGATASYQKAAAFDPKNPLIYEKIADLALAQNEYDSARKYYELAVSFDPNNAVVSTKFARALIGQRNILQAREVVDRITPPTQKSLYIQGTIAAFYNERERAEKLLKQSASLGSDPLVQRDVDRILGSFREFSFAKDGKPEHLQALLAKSFAESGEYGLAIELAFDALKTEQDYRDVWIILGYSFLQENRALDAEDSFSRAIALDADSASTYLYRGLARKRLGKLRDAQRDFDSAVEAGWKPSIFPKEQSAELAYQLGNFETAFERSREVARSDPTDPKRFVRPISIAIERLSRAPDALDLAELAFRTHPDSALTMNLLGWAHLANNNLTQARTYLESARLRDNRSAAIYLNLGNLEARSANNELAVRNFEAALDLANKSGETGIAAAAQKKIQELRIQGQKSSVISAPQIKQTPAPKAEVLAPPAPTTTPTPPKKIPRPRTPPAFKAPSLSLQ